MGKKIKKTVNSASRIDTHLRAGRTKIVGQLMKGSKKVDAQGAKKWGHDGAFQGDN